MKKIMVIITVLFFSASLFTSCVTDEGDNISQLTSKGMTMTSEWNNATDYIFRCYAGIPFYLHHCIEKGQFNTEENGLDVHTKDDGVVEIYVNGKMVYTVNTNKQPLDSIGAKWELTSVADYSDFGLRQYDYSVNFTITCIDKYSWNIYSLNKDMPEYFFDVNIVCTNMPDTLYDSSFVFSGEGNLLIPTYYYGYSELPYYSKKTFYEPYIDYLENPVNLHFETEVDMQKTPVYWSKGVISIVVQNKEEKTSSTIAEFFRRYSEYFVNITYGGVTEEWIGYGYY